MQAYTEHRLSMAVFRHLCVATAVIAVLTGCGTRGSITLVEPDPAVGKTERVIVATSRMASAAPEFFSGERDFTLNFARFDVSIPPDREPGTIRYPKGEPDPQTDFVVTGSSDLDGPRAFVQAVNSTQPSFPSSKRAGIVFVHGFNTNFAEGLYKDVQLRHDLESPGVGVFFSWPSEAKLLSYVADRENALFSRDALAETLALMSQTNLDGYNLVAHSMGTFLAMETMRTLALSGDRATLSKIDAVILISADIEVDVFRRQAPPVLAAGIPIYLLVSDDDKALQISALIRGETKGTRVGQVRSTAELGGLDVGIIDLSEIDSRGGADHLKIATSPELIAFVQRIRDSGVAIFEDGQKVGLLDQGAVLIQSAGGVVLNPLGQ